MDWHHYPFVKEVNIYHNGDERMRHLNLNRQFEKAAKLIRESNQLYTITGAGISTVVGIPDLAHLPRGRNLSSEFALEADPQRFYQDFHQVFIDPIFNYGPSRAHQILAKWETAGLLKGIITTNVDYLHELAGSRQVADVWRNLNINYCLKCGRTYDINVLKASVPQCPECGGLISPDPVYHNIATDDDAVRRANAWMDQADLVITIGTNGYYPNTGTAKIIDINPVNDGFTSEATLQLRTTADNGLAKLDQLLKY